MNLIETDTLFSLDDVFYKITRRNNCVSTKFGTLNKTAVNLKSFFLDPQQYGNWVTVKKKTYLFSYPNDTRNVFQNNPIFEKLLKS